MGARAPAICCEASARADYFNSIAHWLRQHPSSGAASALGKTRNSESRTARLPAFPTNQTVGMACDEGRLRLSVRRFVEPSGNRPPVARVQQRRFELERASIVFPTLILNDEAGAISYGRFKTHRTEPQPAWHGTTGRLSFSRNSVGRRRQDPGPRQIGDQRRSNGLEGRIACLVVDISDQDLATETLNSQGFRAAAPACASVAHCPCGRRHTVRVGKGHRVNAVLLFKRLPRQYGGPDDRRDLVYLAELSDRRVYYRNHSGTRGSDRLRRARRLVRAVSQL